MRRDPVIDIDRLSSAERARLGPSLYDIFRRSYGELDQDTVCGEIVFRPGGELTVYRDAGGTVVGFVSVGIDPLEVDGHRCSVMQAGAYFERGLGGGAHAVRCGLRASLEHKLRHPFRPLYYVVEALNPVPYRRLVSSFPRAFPSQGHRVRPPRAPEVLSAVIEQRGLRRSGSHPFVVRYPDPASHADADHILMSESLRSDPDIRFYLEHNPHFEDGHILCAIVSLDLRDLLVASYWQMLQPLRRIMS